MGGGVGWEPRVAADPWYELSRAAACVIDSPAEPGMVFLLPAARPGVEPHGFELWSRIVNVPPGMERQFEISICINSVEFGRFPLPAASDQVRNGAGEIPFKAVLPLSQHGAYQVTLSLVQLAPQHEPETRVCRGRQQATAQGAVVEQPLYCQMVHTSFTLKRSSPGDPLPFPEDAWSRCTTPHAPSVLQGYLVHTPVAFSATGVPSLPGGRLEQAP